MKRILVVAALLPVMATVGQMRHEGESRQRGEGEMGMMMQVQRYSPDIVLDMAGDLDLTDTQLASVEQILAERDSLVAVGEAAHELHREQLMEALGDVNVEEGVVIGHMTGAHDGMGVSHRARLIAAIRVRALLTAEQRELVPEHRGMGNRNH